jgi:hypothetical protein
MIHINPIRLDSQPVSGGLSVEALINSDGPWNSLIPLRVSNPLRSRTLGLGIRCGTVVVLTITIDTGVIVGLYKTS